MLEEYKQTYMNSANRISNWRDINKNTLCNMYIDETNPMKKESYFSAIVCNYWGYIYKFYGISSNIATVYDVYNWLIDSIVYALEHKAWRNPKSSIYQDPNGPDKVINRQIRCRRFTAYQNFNRYKRKPQFMDVSIDELDDEGYNSSAYCDPTDMGKEVRGEVTINNLIKKHFESQEYLTAFIIDNIAYGDIFVTGKERLSESIEEDKSQKENPQEHKDKKFSATVTTERYSRTLLVQKLKELSENDAPYFAKRYNLPEEVVKQKVMKYCKDCDSTYLQKLIDNTLTSLKYTLFSDEVRSKQGNTVLDAVPCNLFN